MKIVELVNSLEFGGTERHVVDLAVSLQGLGHAVHVVCLRGAGPLAAQLESAGVEVVTLDKPEGPNLRVLRRLIGILEHQRIDVVHSHNPLVHHYGLVAARWAGVPVVVNTIHGIRNLSTRRQFKEILYSISCRATDRVVAVAPSAYRAFVAGGVIPRSKLTVINNGIPLDAFVAIPARQPGPQFVFGIVGRLEAVKDHRSLLHAMATVVKERSDCRLEILGDGPERAALESLTAELGIGAYVTFHGFRTDVANFLAGIDVAVLCSTSEALPLGVLEAMAAARPVVGTTVGAIPDLIGQGGCGWLCPPSRPQELAVAMRAALNAPSAERSAMGARGRDHAISEYSLPRMVAQYAQLFEDLLARHRVSRAARGATV
jgi:glycosyltransferase involved in cell wall biosynthesis